MIRGSRPPSRERSRDYAAMYASDKFLRPLSVAAIGVLFFLAGSYYGGGKVVVVNEESSPHDIMEPHQQQHGKSSSESSPSSSANIIADVHPSCSRKPAPDLKDRPLLIFKYARTGSTWLAWSGDTMKLASNKDMIWTWEAQGCAFHGPDESTGTSEKLVTWLAEYFSKETNGTIISKSTPKRNSRRHPDGYNPKCLTTAGKNENKLGVLVATMNPHPTHALTPSLSDKDWQRIFQAAPNLAIGVLVRTNSVKRAVSAIASEKQLEICGLKKLTGKEDCIKDLPKKVFVNTTRIWKHIADSEKKRVVIPELAAEISQKYGRKDGIFCLSYEMMQLDIPGEMEALGGFLGADIDPASIDKLREDSVSYKRGSDSLSEYIENYKEVRESLSTNRCVLDQLEADEPRVFPACGVYNSNGEAGSI